MRDTKNLMDEGKGSMPASATNSANRYHCQAKRTGFGDYVACLEPPPQHCGYALRMGDEYLCLHPHHMEIATQAEARQRA
jgi:hypothetical protein